MTESINVLSLFDGMSCAQQALERAGIPVKEYWASEIDKYAITVTQANYPKTKQIGTVVDIDTDLLPWFDALFGGSPCQSFSFAGKRKGMSTKCEEEILTLERYLELKAEGYEFEGQSYLFWEYVRILNALRKANPNIKFLLENVVMAEHWESIITKAIGLRPIRINSALVSAQNRERLYWTNIGMRPAGLFGDLESIIQQPTDKKIFLKDVIEAGPVAEKYFLSPTMLSWLQKHSDKKQAEGCWFKFLIKSPVDKANAINQRVYKMGVDDNYVQTIYQRARGYNEGGQFSEKSPPLTSNSWQQNNTLATRRLTPVECERLQTVFDNYTDCVSDTQRYRMLGNGWTIDAIVHILKYY